MLRGKTPNISATIRGSCKLVKAAQSRDMSIMSEAMKERGFRLTGRVATQTVRI